MQRIIARYGLAAHLALLAVAPLFLFPFFREGPVASVLLWLSLLSGLWVLLEPSLRGGEHPHDARTRVTASIVRDPLFWALFVLVVFTGIRALNSGVALAYDAERSVWYVASAALPLFPGSVGEAGHLPFAASVALLVLVQGCRHAIGRSARMVFLLVSSVLAGLAATIAVSAAACGHAGALAAFGGSETVCSCAGLSFGLFLMAGTVALAAAFDNRWNSVMVLFIFALGGTAAGLFVFAPAFVALGLTSAELVVLTYVFAYACSTLRAAGEFKLLVLVGISFVLGGIFVAMLLPDEVLAAKIAPFVEFSFLSDRFREFRTALSGIAFKSWFAHIWIGSGLASFPLDFRFGASPEDWRLLPRGAVQIPHGWWQMLAERGLVGTVFFVLPFGFLFFTYVRRLIGWLSVRTFPHPACLAGPLAVAAFIAEGFFGCSFMRAETVLAVGAALAVAAAAFPRKKGVNDVR